MKVIDLIKVLEKLPKDAEVEYFDTYWESEGYGAHAKEPAWNTVGDVYYNKENNSVELS